MKQMLMFIVLLGSCSYSQTGSEESPKEYFVRPCEFVCDYPFNDTTKWAITCRVWGLLKYYHPNVTVGKLDWDEILLDRLEAINVSSTPEMVNAELKTMLDAAGKYSNKREDDWNDSLNMNVNLCWLNNSFLDDTLQNELKKIASLSVKELPYYGIINSTMDFITPNEKVYDVDMTTSFYHRLLSLFRYWNVIYYFSPHKYLMDKSWDTTLNESIFPFINATDSLSYKIAFLKLAAALNDGHGYITIENGYPNDSQDIIELIEGKTIVKIDRGGLHKGDIVSGIGGQDIDYIRDSLSLLIPASTQWNKEYRTNCYVAEMIFFHETEVAISRDNQQLVIHTVPYPFMKNYLPPHRWVSNDIGYVDLSLLTTKDIDLIFQTFSDTKGIIFDLRKVGSYKYDVGELESHLTDPKVLHFFSLIAPDVSHPGSYRWIKDTQKILPDSIEYTPFQGKIVFLINEDTQSFTETQAYVARINFQATLIGRPTSGVLAHIIRVILPDNHMAMFSGFGAFSLVGNELQRKGIIPDIEVYPTMESIKDGKDEILEAAIEYLNKN